MLTTLVRDVESNKKVRNDHNFYCCGKYTTFDIPSSKITKKTVTQGELL